MCVRWNKFWLRHCACGPRWQMPPHFNGRKGNHLGAHLSSHHLMRYFKWRRQKQGIWRTSLSNSPMHAFVFAFLLLEPLWCVHIINITLYCQFLKARHLEKEVVLPFLLLKKQGRPQVALMLFVPLSNYHTTPLPPSLSLSKMVNLIKVIYAIAYLN